MECAGRENSARLILRLWLMSALIYPSIVDGRNFNGLDRLQLGYSSLSPRENRTILVSPDGKFSAGFYNVGINAYCLAVWYSRIPKTVVWMANRDQPVNGRDSSLRFRKDGDLLLVDAGRIPIWRTNTKAPVKEALLLNTGNLVLRSDSKQIVWQSFDSPTDTLLPGQIFTKDSKLISRMELGNYKSGYFRFYFNDENYLGIIYEGLNLSSKYWPPQGNTPCDVFGLGRTTYNITRRASLDQFGGFTSSDKLRFKASDFGELHLRRLTLDIDGNLRLYSLDSQNLSWEITWIALTKQCDVHGLCGFNGVCTYTPEPKCVCPPGFEMEDSTDWFKGCRLIHNLSCAPNSAQFVRLPYTDYYGYDWSGHGYGISFQECKKICMDDCFCLGFSYRSSGTGECSPKHLLISGLQSPDVTSAMYIKISVNDSAAKNISSTLMLMRSGSSQCSREPQPQLQKFSSTVLKNRRKSQLVTATASIVSAIGVTEIICIALGWSFLFRIFQSPSVHNYQGYSAIPGGLRRFKFSELRRATKNFKNSVGKGGFGTVYKGRLLPENKAVAVKRLEGVSQGEDEFRAELNMIGRVNHMNLVQMLGYCAEGKQRLLVYEYVENGSLDNYLFTQDSSKVLDWSKRFQIAVDTARGLSYLHEECLEWILHCDIKPENILLDKNFQAKLSDFGLSKLVDKGHENDRKISALAFSKIRGTRGYLAPEWTMNLPITAKADVYSFGVLLLELVSGRKAAEFNVCGSNFVQWAFDNVRQKRWTENLVDPKLVGSDMEGKTKVEMERVLKTALLCVKQDKNKRPSMSRVVEILMLPINTNDSGEQVVMDTEIGISPA